MSNKKFDRSNVRLDVVNRKTIEKELEKRRETERGERFLAAMEGKTYAGIAEAVGAAASTIHNYASGKIPSADVALKIANYLGVDLEWWITGEGQSLAEASAVVYIPLRMSGMSGGFITYAAGLIGTLGRRAESLYAVYAVGSMMAPTIPKGSELICSSDVFPLKDGAIYLLQSGDHEIVRRLRVRMNGSLEAICDNPQVSGEKGETVNSESVLAEVVWISHAPLL